MAIVLDYTSRIPVPSLKAAGAVGVCRYLAWSNVSQWKMITKAEYDELRNGGIDVYLNWENVARDWLGGASAGKTHGEEAVRQAKALKYPPGSVIIGSCDFDITRSQWSASGRSYARAFAEAVIAGGYRPGAYGPWDVIQWLSEEDIMDAFWQAGMSTAWSNGRNKNPHPLAHIRQRGHKTVGGKDTDWNEIRRTPIFGGTVVMSDRVLLDLPHYNILARIAQRMGALYAGQEYAEYTLTDPATGKVSTFKEKNGVQAQIAVHDSRVSQVETDIAEMKSMLSEILTRLNSTGIPAGGTAVSFTGTFTATAQNSSEE